MRRQRSRTAVIGSLLFVTVAVSAGGYAVALAVADDPRDGMRYCPSPQEPRLPPGTPCISQDPNLKYQENHGYRREQEITAEQRAGAQGKAEALAEALKGLAGKPVGEAEIVAAAATALGLEPGRIEYRQLRRPEALVGGGSGKVCVIGTMGREGHAAAEVTGRTLDGTCLPGLGGH